MTDPAEAVRRPAWVRLASTAALGVGSGVLVGVLSEASIGLAAGWLVGSGTYIAWVWLVVARMDAAQTRRHATREDPGIALGEGILLGASVASLGAVALVLIRAHQLDGLARDAVAGLALLMIASSWGIIHTRYMLRYARIYYTDPIGGIDFHGAVEEARYVDFGYVAFNIGQTFQISDTSLLTSELRAVVMRHTLLSYVFSTAVLATLINLVAGLG